MSAHYPVMLNEVLENLAPVDGGVYVDGTFGAGGYSQAILDSADCVVVAIDRDASVMPRVEELKALYGDRFVFVSGCFGNALELVRNAGYEFIDGFVIDIGVSSMQIDQADRGFSFRFDGPLDMRMNKSAGATAADIVNTYEEEDLANVIYRYGEERLSRRIAKKIVERRVEEKFETTIDLADIVRSCVPRSPKDKIDPATRTFQALRIAVNDELGELERGLEGAEDLLRDGGRLVVVAFHSLEDGIVKAFTYERSGRISGGSRHMPVAPQDVPVPTFKLEKRKAIIPTDVETKENARSRSAKLRVAVRVKEGEDV